MINYNIYLDASMPSITGICKSIIISLNARLIHPHYLLNPSLNNYNAISPFAASIISKLKLFFAISLIGIMLNSISSTTRILGTQSQSLLFYSD